MRRRLLVLSGLLVALAGSRPAGAAVTYQVNSTADDSDASPGDGICQTSSPGVCTLRAAVEEANVTGGTIEVPAITIPVSSPLVIAHTMSIEGAGTKATVISGAFVNRILDVFPPANTVITLTLRDATLRDGLSTGGGGMASLASGGILVLERCLVVHNSALFGGAVSCDLDSAVTVRDSELTDNHAPTGNGGAVYGNRCLLTVSGTAIHHNTAALGAGLFALNGGSVQLSNTTVGENIADQSGGGIYVGGGSGLTSVTLYNTTVAANVAKASAGGGIKIEFNGSVALQSSMLAYNQTGTQITAQSDCSGPLTSSGNNIITYTGGGCTVTGPVATNDPLLGQLQDNGGAARSWAATRARRS